MNKKYIVYVVVACLPVCHEPVLYRNDWTNRASFWHGGFLLSIRCCVIRKYAYLQKSGYFPLGLFPELRTLENFATASRSRCQQHSSSSSSTVEFVDDTCTTIDESWLFTTSRSTVTLWLHYWDLLRICCTTCFYGWQDFDWHSASRGPSAVAELRVWCWFSTRHRCKTNRGQESVSIVGSHWRPCRLPLFMADFDCRKRDNVGPRVAGLRHFSLFNV